jgi:hypothetical protein
MGTALAANDHLTEADCEEPIAAAHGYGRAMEKSVQWMTLQELRDELERTRPAWEAEVADLDSVLAFGQLPVLSEDAQRHQMVANELLRRPSED